MKKTLFFELCASMLVVVLLAGFNALAGKASQVDSEFSLLPGKTGAVIMTEHRRHGHARRHHQRSSHHRPEGNHEQARAQHAANGSVQPASTPAVPAKPAAAAPATHAQPPVVR